jgi:hypothetical protein
MLLQKNIRRINMLNIIGCLVGILAIYLVIKVMSAFFTFFAAAFIPLLILAAVGFLVRGVIRGKERRAPATRGQA